MTAPKGKVPAPMEAACRAGNARRRDKLLAQGQWRHQISGSAQPSHGQPLPDQSRTPTVTACAPALPPAPRAASTPLAGPRRRRGLWWACRGPRPRRRASATAGLLGVPCRTAGSRPRRPGPRARPRHASVGRERWPAARGPHSWPNQRPAPRAPRAPRASPGRTGLCPGDDPYARVAGTRCGTQRSAAG